MAIGDFRLTNSRYVRPGTYIGYVRIPRPTTDPGNPRYPCYIGRGSRLALVVNLPHRRSYVENLQLNFSTTPPYLATLQFPAINDQGIAFLYKQNREVVSTDKWAFRESSPGSGVWNQVEIQLTEFDKNATYLIDYQSTERDALLDDLNFSELRQMGNVGDTEGQNKYQEFTDYRIVTDLVGNTAGGDTDALIPGENNSALVGRNNTVVPTPALPAATIAHNANSTYTYDYAMRFTLVVEPVVPVGGPTTFEFRALPLSGGNDQMDKVPQVSAFEGTGEYNDPANLTGRAIEFSVANGAPTTLSLAALLPSYLAQMTAGIVLDFDTSGGDFVAAGEYTWDSYGPGMIEFSSAHDNDNQFAEVTEPAEVANYLTALDASSSGKISISTTSEYTGTKDRHYKMQVYYPAGPGPTGTGPAGNRLFDIAWSAWDEMPYSEGNIEVQEAVPQKLTNLFVEKGVYIDVDLGAGHAIADDENAILLGPATNLATSIALATQAQTFWDYHDNNFENDGATPKVYHTLGAGSHQTTLGAPTNEAQLVSVCVELQTLYIAHINDSAMHIPIDDVWALANVVVVDLATCVTFLNDYKAKTNRHIFALNFVEGDTWTFTALAARKDYSAKDDRLYNFSVGTVIPAAGLESMAIAWYTDTYEGSFGNFTVLGTNPYASMTDNIDLSVRNFPIDDGANEQYATADVFTFTTVNEDKIDWSLRTRAEQTIPEDEIFHDVLGQVTGIPLAYYIILDDTPDAIVWVREASTGTLLSYTQVYDAGETTPYIAFNVLPTDDVEVKYEHRGQEPDPGNIYYISAQRLRLNSEYNVPIRYLTRDDMARGLGPKTTDNQLWIAGDIAFDTDFFGAYFTQVLDAAGNQVFSTADFRAAIQATETVKDITDLIVLSFFPALAESKASIARMADPFENAERMLWVGTPIGTPLGDDNTPDSMVYLARKTLQFSGDNPGRGHVVLIGNTDATREIVMDDGTVTSVILDGSFIAAYTAARNAAFRDPAQTLLRKDCSSFGEMQTWGEKEELILGGSSITYLSDAGSGIFRYGESETVDTSAPDLQEISAMNQKIYVTRKVSRDMDQALISIVPPSPAAGVAIVRAYLSDELATIVSSGVIAPYGSESNPPTIRQINASTDIYVFVDERDRRLYHFGYFYNLRYPIKRLFGLYSVDTRFWDNRQ